MLRAIKLMFYMTSGKETYQLINKLIEYRIEMTKMINAGRSSMNALFTIRLNAVY